MTRAKSIPIRRTLRKIFPAVFLRSLAKVSGAFKRLRRIDPVDLFWTLVLGFGTGDERTIAGLRPSYEKTTGQRVEESSFYDRFTPGLVKMLKIASAHALQESLGVGRALEGPLAAFRDVLLTDSTIIRLHDLLAKDFPGCRTNHSKAALKAHAILSVTGAGQQSIKVTSGRRHDGPVLKVGKWVKDRLFLFDLGYFHYALFANITRNEGYYLSRLKGNANPTIVALNCTHRGRAIPIVGERLHDVVGRMEREVLDVMVEVKYEKRRYAGKVHRARQIVRVVGIWDENTNAYHLYATNVPPDKLAAEDIQAVYALRWQVELFFKELKRHYRIEDMPSGRREIVEALLYAAIITMVVSRRLLALVRAALGNLAERVPNLRWAAILQTVAQDLLALVLRAPRESGDLGHRIAALLLHEAVDPNKSRPGLLQAVEQRTHSYRPRAANA